MIRDVNPPAISTKLSKIEGVREGTKLCRYSSTSEYTTIKAAEVRNHLLRSPCRGEPRKARAARNPNTAYSTKCASFRTSTCTTVRVSADAFGKNQRKSGPIILEVLFAEKLADEAKEMKIIHPTSGKYLQRNVREFGLEGESTDDIGTQKQRWEASHRFPSFCSDLTDHLEGSRSRDDLNNLICDRCLTHPIHV